MVPEHSLQPLEERMNRDDPVSKSTYDGSERGKRRVVWTVTGEKEREGDYDQLIRRRRAVAKYIVIDQRILFFGLEEEGR